MSTSNKSCETSTFKSFCNTLENVICYVHGVGSPNAMSVALMPEPPHIFCLVLERASGEVRELDISPRGQLKSGPTCRHDEILVLAGAAALL